ncbi:replication-relaxation family protein [Saccharopolyspora shandongensis]|uniref:replication-relaxation family protein n=1 Tax=Saccharopolyspora shandongensis TaxID=418495 RepID=UPI0033C5D472
MDKSAGQRLSGGIREDGRLNTHLKHSHAGPRGRRGRGRRAGEPDSSVWFRLTDRDRRILGLLGEHKVLTTRQIAVAEFDSVRRAQDRLTQLRTLGVVFSFRESYRAGGTSQTRFALGYLGARAMAAQRAERPPTQPGHQRALESLAWWPKLEHQLGVNGFFCDLAGHARRARKDTHDATLNGGDADTGGLMQWWSEKRCTEFFWNSTVKLRPDGYGCWAERGRWVRFFLEYDTGTEALSKVTAKIRGYSEFPTDAFGILLFSVHSSKREIALRQALRRAVGAGRLSLVIATTARDQEHPYGPAGPVWALWTSDHGGPVPRRYRLAELPQRGQDIEAHQPWVGQPYSEAAFDPQDQELVRLAESRPPATTSQHEPDTQGGDLGDEVMLYDEDDPDDQYEQRIA